MQGRIIEEDIRAVSEQCDIIKIIGEQVVLRKKGRYFWGLCPFHDEKTPSFKVDTVTQLYYCFGCGQGGNVFSYIKSVHKVDFPEAVEMVADKIGFTLKRERFREGQFDQKKRLIQANDSAKDFYIETLNSNSGIKAKKYLMSRGITEKLISEFELGYAPANRTGLYNYLSGKGFKREEMAQAGLISLSGGQPRDLMIDRIIFPINDASAKTVAFGGRTMSGSMPKYLNSPESRIYHKSSILYGLDKAKGALKEDSRIIIVEGYTDLIALHSVGIKNSVATLGTSLTADHLRILSRHTDQAVLLFDGDSAGMSAAERVLNLGEDSLLLSVALLPKSKDPADLVMEGKAGQVLKSLIDKAVPVTQFCLERIIASEPLTSMKSKLNAVDKALVVIEKISNPIIKAENRRFFAEKTGIEEELLDARARGSQKNAAKKLNLTVDRSVPPPPIISGKEKTEREMLKILLKNETETNYMDFLDEEDFTNAQYKDMIRVLKIYQLGNKANEFIERLDEEQKKLAVQLVMEELLTKDLNKHSFEIYNKIKEFRIECQINSLKSVLQRISPLKESERYNGLFEELIQLEAEKRDLKSTVLDGGS